ncbi:unnamed protein product [Cyprideis torosa]|uniref:Uncharacterized protein n=1 Tax=Cyprideis torosa TaxID=163714 RepID=A0A7R8ZN75_9CRUS|nr:unnamed protein product [Cyprideis torosa]CAG0887249.1 unnamed protein product [Cyprideis torosa]
MNNAAQPKTKQDPTNTHPNTNAKVFGARASSGILSENSCEKTFLCRMVDAQIEKGLRSVFVGNISYELTEEKLKEIFSQVGPVLNFK